MSDLCCNFAPSNFYNYVPTRTRTTHEGRPYTCGLSTTRNSGCCGQCHSEQPGRYARGGEFRLRLCCGEPSPGSEAIADERKTAEQPLHGVRRCRYRSNAAGAQLLFAVPAVVAIRGAVQGRKARALPRASQHRRRQCSDDRREPCSGLRRILLIRQKTQRLQTKDRMLVHSCLLSFSASA